MGLIHVPKPSKVYTAHASFSAQRNTKISLSNSAIIMSIKCLGASKEGSGASTEAATFLSMGGSDVFFLLMEGSDGRSE